jgi:hypothetical protein
MKSDTLYLAMVLDNCSATFPAAALIFDVLKGQVLDSAIDGSKKKAVNLNTYYVMGSYKRCKLLCNKVWRS